MTVNELCKRFSFESLCTPDSEREISGAYCGDLLSWVMGHAQSGDAWITIMSNINTVAVASLADVSCIVLLPRYGIKRYFQDERGSKIL